MSEDKEKYSKTDHGASRRVGVCGGWRETNFVLCGKIFLLALLVLFLIFNFFIFFNIQNALLFLFEFYIPSAGSAPLRV